MTDNQFYVLITVIGAGLAGIGAAIRFSVGRVVSALDLNSANMLENTKSNAVLTTKIDGIAQFVQGRSRSPTDSAQQRSEAHTAALRQQAQALSPEIREFIRDEISGVHEAADPNATLGEKVKRAPTQGGGQYNLSKRGG